jgi:hypothetical protein
MTLKDASDIFSGRFMLSNDTQTLAEGKNRAKTELTHLCINSASTNHNYKRATKALQSAEKSRKSCTYRRCLSRAQVI